MFSLCFPNSKHEHAQLEQRPYIGPRFYWAWSKSNFTRSSFPLAVGDLGTRLETS